MNILLCCSVGMSTSLLVSRMKRNAAERGIQCRIWAVPADVVIKQVCEADVLLLGPQIRFLLPELKGIARGKGIPVEVIDTVHYGTFDGQKVLDIAIKLYENKQSG